MILQSRACFIIRAALYRPFDGGRGGVARGLDRCSGWDAVAVIGHGFVVMSGLPGSGKSTVGRALAEYLALPVIDKDVILEALYDSLGIGDQDWRGRLSRAGDEVLFALAAQAGRAVLDNWWHHDSAPARLRGLGGRLVEVFCDCDPALAAQRFLARTRHPGHLDPQLSADQVAARVAALRATYPGPLRLGGPLVIVDTHARVDARALAEQITDLLPDTQSPTSAPRAPTAQ